MKKQRSETSEGGGRGEGRGEARNDMKTPAGAEAESFGPWLRRQREMREIDLREISDASKISLRYLQAFEENRFDELPADVFAKGFLRHYARFVGIDQEEAVNFFSQARKEADQRQGEDEVTRVVKIRSSSKSSSSRRRVSANRRFVLVILLAAALLLVVIWQLSQWQQRQELAEFTPPAVAIPSAPLPSDSAEASGAPAGDGTLAGDPNATGADTAVTDRAAVDPATGLPLAGQPPAANDPAVPAGDPALAQPALPPVAEPAAPTVDPAQIPQQQALAGDLIRVALDFQGQCWVEALVDGKRQQSATRAQGESVVYSGNELIEIKLGDYQAAQVEINGKAIQLRSDNQRGSTVRLRIDLPYVASLTGVPLDTLQQALAQRKKSPNPR